MNTTLLKVLCIFAFIHFVIGNVRVNRDYDIHPGFAYAPFKSPAKLQRVSAAVPLLNPASAIANRRQENVNVSQILGASEQFSFDLAQVSGC